MKQVKAFIGTTAHTQGLQGTVSLIVLENEKRISKYLKEIKDFFSQSEEPLETDRREPLLGEDSWIIRYAIAAPA